MIILEDILSQEIIQKLGWTLLHFIWQAAVLALLLAILLKVLRKSTANLRYIFACLALALIVLLPVITIQLVPVSVPHSTTHIEPAPVPAVLLTEGMPAAENIIVEEPVQSESITFVSADSWKQRTIEVFEPALPYIVSGWLVGVFGLSIWHLGGWAQLQRLRQRMVKQVDYTLDSKLKVLAQRLRVKQTVHLMESALVQIPTVIGWLRPVILLPASALTGLNSEQLEAILAHELAHIKRVDYLLNIMQTVVEILGFYHPAVWWVSHKIRAERENCCDDLAVSISGDRVCYARALTSMEEIRTGQGQLAVAATGGNLFKRIYRLLGKDKTDKTGFSWIPAVTTILLIIALVIPTTLALTTNRADDQSNTNLETILLDGFRENRSKFKCGVLAWTRTTKNDGFTEDANLEHGGSFQLWWDDKKIATKYVQDRVCRDSRGGPYWIEKQIGGNAYNGSIFSRKPKFGLYENWLEEVIRWQGRGSLDNMIVILKKQKNLTVNWSMVDVDGNKMFKLFAKNMDETESDYGAYSVEYYDPSKGYGLVNQEWYNSQNQLRMKHTVKLEQVIPDGWFPVEVDFKSFNPKQGKVRLHQHFVLDMKRCSFNERLAIPDGIFEFSTAKEQEQLNKILEKYSDGKTADENNENVKSVCESVENYIAAALAGEDEKAAAYAYPGSAVVQQTDDTREVFQDQPARIVAVCSGQWNSLAISSVIQADHGRVGPAVFHLKKEISEQKVHWLIDDIDLETLETLDTVEREIADFLSKNPEARTVIVKPRRPMVSPDLSADKETDVSVEDDILLATEQEKESSPESIPVPVLAKSPSPPDKDKAHVKANCLVVEVPLDSKIDTETLREAEKILGNKINLSNTTVDVILRQVAKATAAAKDESTENKRITEQQFNAFVEMLTSKGYMKILMIPILEVMDGQVAKIIGTVSPLHESSLEITPHVLADGDIILDVKADLSSQDTPVFEEPAPVSSRQFSTRMRARPGESLIMGGLIENIPAPGDNIKDSENKAKEVLFFITPTIITPPAASQQTADTQIEVKRALSADKLKKLGLAVIMYADDNDNKLPDTLEPLKPYIANEQDYLWIVNNVEYIGKSKTYLPNQPRTPVAYDKTQIDEQSGTDVLFLDGHVEFVILAKLKKLLGVEKRFESAKKLSNLGHALFIYANDHEDKYPDSLHELRGYLKTEDVAWTRQNVEYLAHGKTVSVRPDTVIAYDKTLLAARKGTNVLFNDSHVDFVKPERLKELGISATEILIDTRLLSVSEDFLQSIGLDANSVSSSDAWLEHLVADSAAEPNAETYSLILDELHISFFLKAIGAHKDAHVLVSPRVLTREGTTAEIGIMTEEYYILGYTEPNRPSDKPIPKVDKVELGTRLWLKPELTPDNQNIKLDFKMDFRQLLGYEERKYKGKYIYLVPQLEVVSTKMPCLIPDGKTLLIGGQKITEQASAAPILSRLPVVGGLFRNRDKTKDQRILLILVKPIINPQQKAKKILPGQEDSEEHIKHLANQLEKKLNPPAD